MCQSSAINRHLLRTQTSFRCKASLEISPETRLSYLLSGSSHFGSCLEMAWEQISLAVPVFLHFLGVKPQSTETNLWKEKKNQNYRCYSMRKCLLCDILPTISSFWEFTLGCIHGACICLIGTVMCRRGHLLWGSPGRNDCNSRPLKSGWVRKPSAALRGSGPAWPESLHVLLANRAGVETRLWNWGIRILSSTCLPLALLWKLR